MSTKLFAFITSLLLLCACTQVVKEPQFNTEPKAKKVRVETPYSMPAKAYLALAENQNIEEKQNLLILASGRLIYEGKWQDGQQILRQTENLSSTQAKLKNILLAKIALIQDKPKLALGTLAKVGSASELTSFYQIQYHELLAQSFDAAHRSQESIVERIKLERFYESEAEKLNNQKNLWLTLTKLPEAELNTLAVEASPHSSLGGWAKLALIARSNQNGENLLAEMKSWQQQYPGHAANALLPESADSLKPFLYQNTKKLALLLPLSGSLKGPGNAIRDGFMDAAKGYEVQIQVYDTAKTKASTLYNEAVANGADYIVGPLTKSDAAMVAALEHPVPTLLLNDVDLTNNKNIYRFGLSPSNEARQVAIKANKNGYNHALIIAPKGAWGDEIIRAFKAEWKEKGGVVTDELAYEEHSNLNQDIRELLHVTEAEAREKQIKRLLGEHIQTVSGRRADFDMIFLLAYPSKARQIMPLLRYYFAANVPVYATSAVYAGTVDTMKDKDLNGIIFSDMPSVFSLQKATRNWPEQLNSYNRLYALGADSFALSQQFNYLLLFPALNINNKNGILYLNKQNQIARISVFGQFKNGLAITENIS